MKPKVAFKSQYLLYSDRTFEKPLLSRCIKSSLSSWDIQEGRKTPLSPILSFKLFVLFSLFFFSVKTFNSPTFFCCKPLHFNGTSKSSLCTQERKKRVKSLVWHTKSMHESIKMNAFGALWGKGERRMASKEGDKSERWHTLKRREMDADRGGEGGKRKEKRSGVLF